MCTEKFSLRWKNLERYQLRGRIWIEGLSGTFLGYGRVVLLERIRDYGSISAAARSMEMSYRHAWKLVESMNSQSSTPLVEKIAGGKGGGGAILTKTGEQAIDTFWLVYKEFQVFLNERHVQERLPESCRIKFTDKKA